MERAGVDNAFQDGAALQLERQAKTARACNAPLPTPKPASISSSVVIPLTYYLRPFASWQDLFRHHLLRRRRVTVDLRLRGLGSCGVCLCVCVSAAGGQ